MRYYSSSSDFYYDTTASTLNYYIAVNGETIYNGKAVKSPSKDAISIDVGKRVRDYIRISMPDFSDYDGVVVPHPEAMLVFNLFNLDSGELLEQYNVRLDDTKEWSGEEGCLSEPINTHADPRQKIFYGHSSSGDTSVDVDSYVPNPKIVFDSPFSFGWESGVTTICYTANTDFTLSSYSGGWFSVTQAKADEFTGCLTFTYSENSGDSRNGNVCMEAEDGVQCFPVVQQEKVTEYYFNLLTPSYQVIGSGSTYYTIEWDTNYESVKYSYNSASTITTTSSSLTLSFPENDTDEDITRSVVFYDSNLTQLATAVWKQEHKASEYYFNFLTPDGQYVAASDTAYTITWDTNYPSVVYVFNGNRTTTSSSGATLTFPANTSSADTIPYSVSVYTTGNTLLGTLTWSQQVDLGPYGNEYFTLRIASDGKIGWRGGTSTSITIYDYTILCSKNGGSWARISADGQPGGVYFIDVVSGDTLQFKEERETYDATGFGVSGNMFSGSTAVYDVEGNIMSLFYGDDFRGYTEFKESDKRTTISKCFWSEPVRHAGNLILPSAKVPLSAYYGMFTYCHNLLEGPVILGTSFEVSACERMFEDCSSITTTPEIKATGTLGDGAFRRAFKDCSSLEEFVGDLSGTQEGTEVFARMFEGCTSLTTPPLLPQTTLNEGSYESMFRNCSSLTTAPVLPAPYIPNNAYWLMFSGCGNLSSVTCYATSMYGNGDTTGSTSKWLYNVSANGTFTKKSGSNIWTSGWDGIPVGWNVIEE